MSKTESSELGGSEYSTDVSDTYRGKFTRHEPCTKQEGEIIKSNSTEPKGLC